ncbi:hypothetical protein RHGRI_001336 [Rhododendron griersonianum]|uniref:Uncharacterized protein n=1 Tax=Rhododendron griersonianum TaxID=479676 RepID=A0AAV6LMY9_9ERIC|nr:hypothetical protein RHGRI_001336 [Rhododendron griersonianum]
MGNMVGRGVVEFCDGAPQVKNFISLAGPHAGIASLPFCGSGVLCILVDYLVKLAVYGSYVQKHLAPANYLKIPTVSELLYLSLGDLNTLIGVKSYSKTNIVIGSNSDVNYFFSQDIDGYIEGCKFLPDLNNEHVNHTNSTYKEQFVSLENLVLIMFEQDKVLVPKETSLFGYYPDGSWSTVLPAQETKLYTEDWIGLKTLDEAGKVKFINVSGGHLDISTSDMLKYIVPYLEDDESSIQRPVMKSYHSWLSYIWNFIKELVGFTEDRILLYTSY